MSKVRVAINGFGRIGRLVLRAALVSGRDDIEFVAVNDLAPAEQNAYLLQYDSVHGKLPMDVKLDGEYIVVGNQKIKCIAEKDPTKLPWRDLDIDVIWIKAQSAFWFLRRLRVRIKRLCSVLIKIL